ncbi:MAG: pyrroline-5-carboxylate reductase [Prolixibacteraceae bacterium]|nr:pyrroline-5-carboxylate reductase [Prolixibacteraceae bacterium]MBN2649074.1 pyrroline-5-carboxylate reductase [Prolixibacteraceae bacterium]
MNNKKIAIIGAGNLGFSIAKGLIVSNAISKDKLVLTESNQQRLEILTQQGYNAISNNKKAVAECDLVMLVVKPWQIDSLLDEIKEEIKTNMPVIVSCVTGILSSHIYDRLNCTPTLFRVMPNTGIAIRESMSCISEHNAKPEEKSYIKKLFSQLGQVLFIPEEQMPAATAMAGCGIAFALRFIRAAIQAGVEIGFSADDAKVMAAQITKGAAELILQNNSHPEAEIDKVTTPKGITITGLNEMEHAGFSSSIIKGLLASYNKIEQKK